MNDRDRLAADDQALSALLDGELSSREAQRLRQRLAQEPALAARLETLRQTDATVRAAYAGFSDQAPPRRVVERLRSPGRIHRKGGGQSVTQLSVTERPRIFIPMAMAASVALVVGWLLGLFAGSGTFAPTPLGSMADGGLIEPGTALYEVLQTVPSARTYPLSPGYTATPRLTFSTRDSSYCRQVDLRSERVRTAMLACRHDGAWQAAVVSFDAAPATPTANGRYRPAAAGQAPVGDVIDALIDGSPLAPEAEQALIARGWTRAPE